MAFLPFFVDYPPLVTTVMPVYHKEKLTLYADRIIVSQQKGLINLHKNKRQTDLNDLSILALFYFIIKILLLLQMKFAFHHIHGIRGTLKFILDAWMSYV